MPRPVTSGLTKLHTDLCKFHAAHGEEAVPKRRREATPEEFSLAKRLAKLRTQQLQSFSGEDSAFISAILERYRQTSEALPRLQRELGQFREQHGEDAIPARTAGASDAEFSLANRLIILRNHVAVGDYTGEDLTLAKAILDTCQPWKPCRDCSESSSNFASSMARMPFLRAQQAPLTQNSPWPTA